MLKSEMQWVEDTVRRIVKEELAAAKSPKTPAKYPEPTKKEVKK